MAQGFEDNLANSIEATRRSLPQETTLHLARSAYAHDLLSAYSQARQDGVTAEEFKRGTHRVLDATGLPIFEQVDEHNTLPGKRQPSLRESVNATVDRFEAIDELEDIFAGPVTSIVYGGSMKYGPFMNVRSGADSSDLDLIVVTDESVLEDLDWRGVMETSLIDERDKLTFFARFGLQRAMYEKGEIDIMSQRFTVANRGYTISSHFMPRDFLDTVYPRSAEGIDPQDDRHKYIRDYKERPFERTHVTNFDMSRRRHEIPVYNRAVDGGFIASNPAYSIIEGRYVPGMYQNLTLPSAKHAFDTTGESTAALQEFSRTVADQERREAQVYPSVSVLNTEPRKPILPIDTTDILGS